MNYSEMLGFTCVSMLYEKNNLLEQMTNINNQLEDIYRYNDFELSSDTNLILYNKEHNLKSQKTQIEERIKEIDDKFYLIAQGLLVAFSRTNILDKEKFWHRNLYYFDTETTYI